MFSKLFMIYLYGVLFNVFLFLTGVLYVFLSKRFSLYNFNFTLPKVIQYLIMSWLTPVLELYMYFRMRNIFK